MARNSKSKRRKPRPAVKFKDRRAFGTRANEREQRIARALMMERQAEHEALWGHDRNAERLSHCAAEMRDPLA